MGRRLQLQSSLLQLLYWWPRQLFVSFQNPEKEEEEDEKEKVEENKQQEEQNESRSTMQSSLAMARSCTLGIWQLFHFFAVIQEEEVENEEEEDEEKEEVEKEEEEVTTTMSLPEECSRVAFEVKAIVSFH